MEIDIKWEGNKRNLCYGERVNVTINIDNRESSYEYAIGAQNLPLFQGFPALWDVVLKKHFREWTHVVGRRTITIL
ncbi:hypothetical protein Plec18170_009810, partial [Paecilomyces lecythidis]